MRPRPGTVDTLPGRGTTPRPNRERAMNTPIYFATLIDHRVRSWFRPPPEFTPAPRPTLFDAELVVAGIEGKATVTAGMAHHLGVRL